MLALNLLAKHEWLVCKSEWHGALEDHFEISLIDHFDRRDILQVSPCKPAGHPTACALLLSERPHARPIDPNDVHGCRSVTLDPFAPYARANVLGNPHRLGCLPHRLGRLIPLRPRRGS